MTLVYKVWLRTGDMVYVNAWSALDAMKVAEAQSGLEAIDSEIDDDGETQ